MKKISGNIFYYRVIFPAIHSAFLGFMFISSFFVLTNEENLVVGLGMFFLSLLFSIPLVLFVRFLRNKVVDEAYDLGGSLKFVKDGEERIIKLEEIYHIGRAWFISFPETIVVETKKESSPGTKFFFIVPYLGHLKMRNSLVTELYDRVQKAKKGEEL